MIIQRKRDESKLTLRDIEPGTVFEMARDIPVDAYGPLIRLAVAGRSTRMKQSPTAARLETGHLLWLNLSEKVRVLSAQLVVED